MKNLNTVLVIGMILISIAWYTNNSKNKLAMKELKESHAIEMDILDTRYKAMMQVIKTLDQKVADQKVQLNETKKQINNVTVYDYTDIPPSERADSIRAIINR